MDNLKKLRKIARGLPEPQLLLLVLFAEFLQDLPRDKELPVRGPG